MKHSYINNHAATEEEKDNNTTTNNSGVAGGRLGNTINKQLVDETINSNTDEDDEHEFLNEKHCSKQHFNELFNQSRYRNTRQHSLTSPSEDEIGKPADTALPKPKDFSEYCIYWLDKIWHFFNSKKKRYRPSGYWKYTINVYKNLFLAFYFNWTVIFTSPLSSLAFITIYPILSGLLFAFEIGLKIFMDFCGGSGLVQRLSSDYGYGFSIINWGAPQLLLSPRSISLARATVPILGKAISENTKPSTEDDYKHRTFDVSFAQTLILLGSLIYERHDEKIAQAFKTLDQYNTSNKTGDEADSRLLPQDIEPQVKKLVWESEKTIRKIARSYHLHFSGVTELKSLSGPFCGLYWPMESADVDPFIVVAFKGTSPTDYSEFLIDCALMRTDARPYLFGAAHEGFYDSLFPTQMDSDSDSPDPYYAIQSAIKAKAEEIQRDPSKPVQVWVTGHSLGAALGTLLFARFLKCPQDLSSRCQLRDAYVIGTPAVGDDDFASGFASSSNIPIDRRSTLWRIVNKSDIIARLPPGYNDRDVNHYVPETDFFNYCHVGHQVKITHEILSAEPIKVSKSNYESNLKVDITVSTTSNSDEKSSPIIQERPDVDLKNYPAWIRPFMDYSSNPISMIESFYPFFLRDHIPIHYFEGLERARVYYSKKLEA